MTLHLIKLCVGAESVEDLRVWQEGRLADAEARGVPGRLVHTTRMVPKRTAALLDGGSLYWVIKGSVQVRQRLTQIEPFVDDEGIRRCHLHLDPELVLTRHQPRRPFQGWRYLDPADAPADLPRGGGGADDMPPEMRAELLELGLL